MTQEEIDNIPEANPLTDNLGAIWLEDHEPMSIVDSNDVYWTFAKNLDTGEKVKVRR